MRLWIPFFVSAYFCGAAFAQSDSSVLPNKTTGDTRLNELRSSPKPKQANDLDTLQLASAYRERAASVSERTNGLWQSWTTSICDGCGNTPTYDKTIRDDFANRKGFADFEAARRQRAAQQKIPLEEYGRRLYSDLSTENIDQIRRMPGR